MSAADWKFTSPSPPSGPARSRWARRWRCSTMPATFYCAPRWTSSRRRLIPATQSVLAKAPADQAANLLAFDATGSRPHHLEHALRPHRAGGRGLARQRTILCLRRRVTRTARRLPGSGRLQLGEITGNDYTVLSGLKPGDQVIVAGGQNLTEGAPIRIDQ